jgi:hypothetical protein
MAGPWYVDDGGDGTTEDSWATAHTNILELDAEKTFAAGEIVYFGHDSNDPYTYSANLQIIGPTDGLPVTFISATQGSNPPTYAASTSNQIETANGAHWIAFDGSFALYGLSMKSGSDIRVQSDNNESFYAENCLFKIGPSKAFFFGAGGNDTKLVNATMDFSSDLVEVTGGTIFNNNTGGTLVINGLSITSASNRTGTFFRLENTDSIVYCTGADFSGLPSTCEIALGGQGRHYFNNCLTAATWTPSTGTVVGVGEVRLYNCGPADAPTYLYQQSSRGTLASSASIYRTGGATVEGDATGWLVTTTAACAEGSPFQSQWIYGEVASTGSKTFTVYITNDTADFTDAQVWPEVEYLGTADEANTTFASDHRVITTTAANHTDDTTSTWNGTGPSFTYKQSLAVTVTVGEVGQYRARVCVGLASIASSRYFYIDPKVTVS